jgi:hypothetical protein
MNHLSEISIERAVAMLLESAPLDPAEYDHLFRCYE